MQFRIRGRHGGGPGNDTKPDTDAGSAVEPDARAVTATDAGAPDVHQGDPAVSVVDAGPSGITKVAAGEYETFYLLDGRLYGVASTTYRLGAGDHPPSALFPPAEVALPSTVTVVDTYGGLHFTVAADSSGHVWQWGDIGANPALQNSNVPTQITPDSKGNEFSGVVSVAAGITTSLAVKSDGTVWVWDDCSGGLQGDGTAGSATVLQPIEVPIPLPSGVKITKALVQGVVVALASDGSVWSWGGGGTIANLGTNNSDYMHPHTLATLPADIVDIATGGNYSYALTSKGDVFAWGQYAEIAGMCSGWCPQTVPLSINATVGLPAAGSATRVSSIYANSEASYVILSDGTLWGWGSNGEGLVGNGVEPDYATTNPPYAWDWGKDDLLVATAVHIAPGVHNFTRLFTGPADVFYAYALTADGQLYSWGRNKTGALGNGVYPMNSQQAATYPNSWDVTTPTRVSPMTATDKPVSSPECVQNPGAASCWCSAAGATGPQDC